MKAIRATLFVSILTLFLGVSASAQAAPSLQPNTLSAHDLGLLFEQDGEPMELALLSEKEMEETQGAWIPAIVAGLFAIRFARYAWGPIGNWFRVGNTFSRSSGVKTFGARWGTNRHYREEIGSSSLRDSNARLRNTRLPGNGWRTQDPGHLHFWRRNHWRN